MTGRRRRTPGRPSPATAACLLALSIATQAVATRPSTFTETAESLAQGHADGMALSREGLLSLSPRISPFGHGGPETEPAQVWAMAADPRGNLFLGTGPDGRVYKIDPSGTRSVLFTAPEPMVTALAVAADGTLLAATAPGGTIYRVDGAGNGVPWSETDELYVWSIVVGEGGGVYAGTGERGRVLEIHRSGSTETLFDGDEPHIVSLRPIPGGGFVAGGAGRGLVYRIDREGHTLVLHDDDLPEVADLRVEPDGGVIAVLLAPPGRESRRPALQLRLPDGVGVGTSDESLGTLEESRGPMLRGTIEGLVHEPGASIAKPRGRVIRIRPDGAVRELWSSNDQTPFCVARDDRGRVLFGTGEPARLYRIDSSGGDVALLSTLREAHLTALATVGPSIFFATSNPAVAYRLEDNVLDTGVFLSRPLDAGGQARWGSIRWNVENPSGRTEVYTRTGNRRDPDPSWSAWSPALTDPSGSPVVNPDGRFLQWRVRQVGGGDSVTRVSGITVVYEPYNRPPEIREFRVEPAGEAGASSRTFRWTTGDPDGDAVDVGLTYRKRGDDDWRHAGDHRGEHPGPARWEWDTSTLEEGDYEVRARVGDLAANARGEGLESGPTPSVRVVVDRTPPELEILPLEDGAVRVRLEDGLSEIRGLEVSGNGLSRAAVRAEDGVCDSRRETFRIDAPSAGAEPWTVRGADAAGNTVESSIQPPLEPK